MAKLNCLHSLHRSSCHMILWEIIVICWFDAQHFLSLLKTIVLLLNIFVDTFTATFDKLDASLLNKSIYISSKKIKLTVPDILNTFVFVCEIYLSEMCLSDMKTNMHISYTFTSTIYSDRYRSLISAEAQNHDYWLTWKNNIHC